MDELNKEEEVVIEPEDRIYSGEACVILEVTNASLANYKKTKKLKKFCKEPRSYASSYKYRWVYSRKEVIALKKRLDLILPLEEAFLNIDETCELTGFQTVDIRRYIKDKDFPVEKAIPEKGGRLFFDKLEVLNWMKEWEGLLPEISHLLTSSQATKVAGYSWRTFKKYMKLGKLRYEAYIHTGKIRAIALKSLGSLGTGYFFKKSEILRFKKWLDLREEESHHNQRNHKPLAFQTSDPSPPIKRTPRVSKEIKEQIQITRVQTGSEGTETLFRLEDRIQKILSNGTALKPQDIYQLVQACKGIQQGWRRLRTRKVSLPQNAGQISLEILTFLSEKVNVISTSGLGMAPLDIYYLIQAESFIQSELIRIEKREIKGVGLSSDDAWEEMDDAPPNTG